MLEIATRPVTTYRKNYLAPDYLIDELDLSFELGESETRVSNRMRVRLNPDIKTKPAGLFLDADSIESKSIYLDGVELDESAYQTKHHGVMLLNLPAKCEVLIITWIKPQENTTLMGLYKSSGNFCTQCEAQGFRRITLFPDRPDILSIYTVTIVADKQKYPVLLSNGNLIDKGESEHGQHWAKWHDPYPKPCYLFALVAGNLSMISDTFITASGRSVSLEVYSEAHNIDQCDFSIKALKKSMRWDEQVYGREYDLDIYMIVAVDDFNMGAMENKGLNIFNTKYVLADSDTATDTDFLGVESVIAHEYFHNWSGNRVTCRDWFQLSLKEGFTVFRDQEFSSDMHSPGVNRIGDVNILRSHQFREDSGPMAHSVRPDSYQQINNFYTLTIYNKGAELVRMIRTIVGVSGFRKGSDLYFNSHDGCAVTIEDFIRAMENANSVDLSQFRLWYSQAGTPVLNVKEDYNENTHEYRLTINQHCPNTPGQTDKQALHIPIVIGLLDCLANEIDLASNDQAIDIKTKRKSAVMHLKQNQQTFVFEHIPNKPVCSLLRGFCAPVKLEMQQSPETLSFLMSKDKDEFSRWDCGQRLMITVLLALIADLQAHNKLQLNALISKSVEDILNADITDPALTALILTPPSELYIAQQMLVIDPTVIHLAREFLIGELAVSLKNQWLSLYHRLEDTGDYVFEKQAIGQRSLRAVCLEYLMTLDDDSVWSLASTQYKNATNMSTRFAGFRAILNSSSAHRESITEDFYQQFKQHALVMDKWLASQAAISNPDTLDKIKLLINHPVFDRKNPNKIRSLIGVFVTQNPVCFHNPDGSGYAFLADWLIELDAINPQVTARLAGAFNSWRRYDEGRQKLMKLQLERVLKLSDLSIDVKEIVSKALS